MFTRPVIYLLVILLASSHGRVATIDETLPDISSNSVTNDAKTSNSTIIVDLPTIRPDGKINATDSESEFKITPVVSTNDSIEITDNTIDTDEDPKRPEPPLILTQYLKENRSADARNASRVNPELFMGVESYSGYFTVNETYESNVFFWYFPVEKKEVEKTPWIVWLQGGPGATSMTGLFDEIGPFRFMPHGLVRNQHTWLQNHSLLFIDNPVGTGFSFTNHEDGYARDMDTYGEHLYSVFRQFLQIFPELRAAPLYVAGESYGGKYVPALAVRIHRNKHTPAGEANLQGLITGNAYVDPPMISQLERPFTYFGLMTPEQLELIQPLIDAFKRDVRDNRSVEAKTKWNYLITIMLLMTQQKHAYNFLKDELPIGRYVHFLRQREVQNALHVGDHQCAYVNMTVNRKLDGDFLTSAKGLYEELLEHYRVLTYCGQLDLMLACVLTSENYRTWRWSGAPDFRAATRYPYIYNNKLAGYHKSGGHLTEAVLRGAGHLAPLDAPAPAQALVAAFTHRRDLPPLALLQGTFVQDYARNHSAIAQYL